jgi:hypothetical protein
MFTTDLLTLSAKSAKLAGVDGFNWLCAELAYSTVHIKAMTLKSATPNNNNRIFITSLFMVNSS